MPRKKASKTKQKKADALITRLMQISLKMDDHIYYNKPISLRNAEDYLTEIAEFKSTCPRSNVRALQVIDKLTRCMKNVIAESSQPNHLTSYHIQQNYPQTASPVYSLPDEDKTEDITVINGILDDIPTVDITEDIDEMQVPKDKDCNPIENVNTAISNMVIQDTFVNEAMITDNDCSQSILEHFDNESVDELNKADIRTEAIPHNKAININTVATLTSSLQGSFVTHQNAEIIDAKNVYRKVNYGVTSRENYIETVDLTGESGGVPRTKINNTLNTFDTICTEHSVRAEYSKRTQEIVNCANNKSNILKNNSTVTVSKIKESKKQTRRKRIKNVESQEKSQFEKTKPEISNIKKYSNKGRKPKNIVIGTNTNVVDISRNKSVSTIYNKNVENDLSWVENLRYVREVSPEENDPILCNLEDSFWNNFSIPSNWNDLDFEI